MQASHSLVVLGFLALLSGLVGLYGVTHEGEISQEEPIAVDRTASQLGAADGALPGVDDSITRTLTALGMIERTPLTGPSAIPDEVARILAAFDVPLVLGSAPGGLP